MGNKTKRSDAELSESDFFEVMLFLKYMTISLSRLSPDCEMTVMLLGRKRDLQYKNRLIKCVL